MTHRDTLLQWLNETLQIPMIADVSYNGLQFEGRTQIRRVVTGVDGSTAFLRRARELKADLAIVHHGLFWRGGELRRIDAITREKLQLLDRADLNLVGIHLPLDLHAEYGNNAIIARRLGATIEGMFADCGGGVKAGIVARLPRPLTVPAFSRLLAAKVAPVTHTLACGGKTIARIGVLSGAGWSAVNDPLVATGGIDAIVTGEIIHQAVGACEDRKIHMFGLGHYATETFGVRAVGDELARRFKLEHRFIDLPTGY